MDFMSNYNYEMMANRQYMPEPTQQAAPETAELNAGGMPQQVQTVTICIDNQSFSCKPTERDCGAIKKRFAEISPKHFSLPDILTAIRSGKTICPAIINPVQKYNKEGQPYFSHCREGWKSQQLFMIDIDNDAGSHIRLPDGDYLTLPQALEICNQNEINLWFAYFSFSSCPEHERYRLAILLDSPVTDPQEREKIQKAFIGLFGKAADKSCTNADRIFYGSCEAYNTDCIRYSNPDAINSKQIFLNLYKVQNPEPPIQTLSPVTPNSQTTYSQPNPSHQSSYLSTSSYSNWYQQFDAQPDELLYYCNPDASYDEWLKITAAYKGAGGDIQTWAAWSQQSHKWKSSDINKWKGIHGTGIAVLKNLAQETPEGRAYIDSLIFQQEQAKQTYLSSQNKSKRKKKSIKKQESQMKETESNQLPKLKFPLFVDYIYKQDYSIRYNQLSHKIEFDGFDYQESPEHLEEIVPIILVDEMEDKFTSASKNRIQDYIIRHATRNRYNPVLEMIQSTEWDGKNYISEVFDIFKLSPDTEEGIYSRIFFQKWLMQCVCGLFNNIENPFSLDITLVFQGKQGIGKTRFFEKLALKSCFFGEGVCLDPRQKDSVEQTTDKWICELGEIGSTMRKDIDSLKAFLTKSTDEYRKSYGRAAIRYPRMVSFVGTVNDAEFLIDATGNRRFATVPLADDLKIDYEKQIKPFNALQMWAQVYNMVKDKDKASCFRLSDDEKAFLDRRNASFLKPLKGEYEVRDVIADLTCGNHTMMDISVTQFIQNNPILQKYTAKAVSQVLDKMGFEQQRKKINGENRRVRYLPVRKYDKIY